VPARRLRADSVRVEHGIDAELFAVIAGCTVVWGLVSSRLERWGVTAPIAFLGFGLFAANRPLQLVHVLPGSTTVRTIAEITLALVLFSDASRVNLRALRRDVGAPARLLLVGLPLTIGLGVLVGLVVFTGIDPWIAAAIAAIVAPTDAALGAPIMEDERIPARVRRILNVESGLNDGIATPIVTFLIAGAAGEIHVAGASGPARALADLAFGAVIGAAAGLIGGWLLAHASRSGWASPAFRPIAVLALAMFAYAASVNAGGNGFVAAFIGGLMFGSVWKGDTAEVLELTSDGGALGSVVVWFLFGALLVPVLDHVGWNTLLYAALSLTVVRMVPVALALVSTHFDRATVGIIGWFGPRGLASIVFGLLAYDALDPVHAQAVLGPVAVVVLVSVVAHGVSARPLSRWYAARMSALHPSVPEAGETVELRTRPFIRPRTRP
jgi:sodium/hydrogen antiporter